ncbi:guanosine-5'-triphosphate,3'-diphosphate diphosphatase [Vibrio hepatarius]|uniref:guanosine-5'-triphosphate,3'-diphosphate diphosphatase n=1 Tax=Vibrio hepatarius TaxID=171383 RepID=UPI001C0A02EF|nr:guanosine-5'-triphosphate,3'-diphosphate diphosphatase [Vibrio hepatarius]MBU2896612.1 guanosine-5'-triphosphate,3'-diphosphate diphosphatase [Vibrio hepatarius]
MRSEASSPLYAAIDLGSNSFHMLVVRHINGSIQTMAKIKRKVRLAAGLDENNRLSQEAMHRGWDCLNLFSERLQDIHQQNIRIVATATLRTATNADVFLNQASQILGYQIDVIDGEEEAATIYKGVAHTSGGCGRRLVVDIGGASTELIIGQGFEAKVLNSLKMGCVTWLENHFKDRQLSAENFESAITAAKERLKPVLKQYTKIGWDVCVGASGTVQALQEIMLAQGMDEVITHTKLKRLQKQAMLTNHLEELEIEGLTLERALVFPSGLSILIAIFELLNIDSMTLSGGALREGLVYEMVDELKQDNIQARTIASVQSRYQLDMAYGEQVANLAHKLLSQCEKNWIPEAQGIAILETAARLHEIGLTIDFKKGGEHGAYLLKHLDLPGYTRAQKQLLSEIIRRYRDNLTSIPQQHAVSDSSARRILRLLRLSILLSHRRNPDLEPSISLKSREDKISITLSSQWCKVNPLTTTELEMEANRQSDLNWPLTIITD